MYLNGHPTERLPGNLNLSFAYVEGEALMMGMRERGGQLRARPARRPAWSRATSCGRWASTTSWPTAASASAWDGSTPTEEVDYVTGEVVRAVTHLRALSPLYEMHARGCA